MVIAPAPEFVFFNAKSRTLEAVPPIETVPAKLFDAEFSKISEPDAPTINVAVPETVKAPDWVIDPPAVAVSAPPTVEAPNRSAFLSVICALLLPELIRLTAPVKSFPESVRVIEFALELNEADVAVAPCTTPPAACVINPPAVMEILFSVLTVVMVGNW